MNINNTNQKKQSNMKNLIEQLKRAELEEIDGNYFLYLDELSIQVDGEIEAVILDDEGDYYTAPSLEIHVYLKEPKFTVFDSDWYVVNIEFSEEEKSLIRECFEDLYGDEVYAEY